MKNLLTAITLLATFTLAACTSPASISSASISTASPIPPATPTTSNTDEENEVRGLVENFGQRLKMVSLLAPSAVQDLQKQYSEFVSPTLLETWLKDVSKAPGRMVSSPWPDRIEITTLTKETSGRYVMDGFIVEITSTEVASGGAADKIPVHIVVGRDQGRWLIIDYQQER